MSDGNLSKDFSLKNIYGHDFYKYGHQKTVFSANTILSLVLDVFPETQSAVDFGCGVGTWLSVLKEKGVKEIQGIDGPWVEKKLLQIPEQDFLQANFEKGITLDRKYDLAISLEVAEHLRPEVARVFVKSLVNASDCILFSAAIPFQGGTNHINEQWPDYWAALFNENGYALLDFIRREIWTEKKIPVWYRQNTFMFVKNERMKDHKTSSFDINRQYLPMAIVHPDAYLLKARKVSTVSNQIFTVKGSWKLFCRAVKKWFKQKFSIAS